VRRTDGIIRRVQPDVAMMLDLLDGLGLPPMDSMSPTDARLFSEALSAARPPGPDVGDVVDGTLPGGDGELAYRLYRPPTDGPHPIIVYFHGGGWVLGSESSDDPFCRDLCVGADAIVVSVNYRHAPEARFPAPVDDAVAAVTWVAEHAADLGGDGTPVAVAGWSAGANLAAVVCQHACQAGGPRLAGQLLVTPVTDGDMAQPSYSENGTGYILTAELMRWFWDHYADPADRSDPRASPLQAGGLEGLPPAVVVTAEFDPLRDEGCAYAEAMDGAGVRVRHVDAPGHTHTSLLAVGMLPSGAPVRAQVFSEFRALIDSAVHA
jgi:acetyl esterase/lipase